jgi:hypothetical protein
MSDDILGFEGGAGDGDGAQNAGGAGAGSGGDAGGQGAGAGAGEGGLPKWHGVLPKDYQGHDALKDVEGMDTLMEKFVALKGLEGRVTVPNKDASDEEKASFFKAIGVPESMDEYGDILPEYKTLFHGAKLSKAQAELLKKGHDAIAAKTKEAEQAAIDKRKAESLDSLKADWSTDFDKNSNIANKALREYADEDTFKALKERYPGLTSDPDVVKIFHKVGKATLDDSVINGTGANGGERPKDKAGRTTFSYGSMKDK